MTVPLEDDLPRDASCAVVAPELDSDSNSSMSHGGDSLLMKHSLGPAFDELQVLTLYGVN